VQLRVDSNLIERCLNGDQTAWTELVTRYQRLVYSVAGVLCSNRDDASDVFQQVWLELYQQLGDIRHIEALPAWLITVTRRRSYAVLNKRYGSEPLESEIADNSRAIEHIEREHLMERALDQLQARCRRLIDLLYFDASEPTYADIAQALGMPESSIGPTRARCLEKLKKILS
jgi:RNA polymerase sigma factor (sigma-70 family)